MKFFEAVVFVVEEVGHDGKLIAEETIRALHDGERLFYDEVRKILFWRGPEHEWERCRWHPQHRRKTITIPTAVHVLAAHPV